MNAIIVSTSGVGHGWGSDPWKWVSGLTAAERAAVRAGGRFSHRVPAAAILSAIGEPDLRLSA
jgi:hypothetical protein